MGLYSSKDKELTRDLDEELVNAEKQIITDVGVDVRTIDDM